MEELNNRIKSLRISEELSQKEFSKRVLVSQQYLSAVEKGREIPSRKFLKIVEEEFGVSPQWLYQGIGEMYLDTYEYDRENTSKEFNSTLFRLMRLLITDSNKNYTSIVLSVDFLVTIIENCHIGSELNIEALEKVSELMANLELLFRVTLSGMYSDAEKYDEQKNKHLFEVENSIKEIMHIIDSQRNSTETNAN